MKALYQLFSALGYTQIALIVLFLGIFVDVVPAIKINPIKAIFNYIGKAFNSSMESELSSLKKEFNDKIGDLSSEQELQRKALDKLILENVEKEVSGYRWDIINFKNNMDNKDKFSRDQYRHIIDTYHRYMGIMQDKDVKITDGQFLEVKEDGEEIEAHYEFHKNDHELLI